MRDRWVSDGASWRFEIPNGWGQGRTVYGGISAAAAVALGYRVTGEKRPLRNLQAQFFRPVTSGDIEGVATVLRQGRSATFVRVDVLQESQIAMSVTMVLAEGREDTTNSDCSDRWHGPPVESLTDLPYIPGVVPEFIQRLQMRWAAGGVPFSGATQADFSGYCRFREPAGGPEGLLGLLDAWPCPSLSLLKTPAPASTVTWTAHLFEVPQQQDGWYGFSYHTVLGTAGMHTVVGKLFDPSGKLIAWTEQLVAVFG